MELYILNGSAALYNGYQCGKEESYSVNNSNNVTSQQHELVTQVYRVIVPLIFSIIVILGVIGNLLVIYVILVRRKLQSVTNLLLLNLALSDVGFLLICGGFYVVHYVLREWPLGGALCRLIQYLLYVTCYVTVYTLIAVSFVRYMTVVHSKHARKICSKRNVLLLIIAMWAVFMLAKIPILIVHGVSTDTETARVECIIVGKTDGRRLFASFFVFAYALPLLLICTLYLMILRHIRVNTKQTHNGTTSSRKRHVTKCVVIVVLTFAICWLPLHVHLLVEFYGNLPTTLTYKVLLIFWHGLSFANSMLNPFIYNYFSREFREAFRSVMRCADYQHPADISTTSHL